MSKISRNFTKKKFIEEYKSRGLTFIIHQFLSSTRDEYVMSQTLDKIQLHLNQLG